MISPSICPNFNVTNMKFCPNWSFGYIIETILIQTLLMTRCYFISYPCSRPLSITATAQPHRSFERFNFRCFSSTVSGEKLVSLLRELLVVTGFHRTQPPPTSPPSSPMDQLQCTPPPSFTLPPSSPMEQEDVPENVRF